jgi:DNA repair exonuclease SbcCD ATPase subunit
MGIAEITQGKAWKNFMAKLYGIGASIVIVGALFKIQHWPGAGPMLIAGLGTEAVIFFFSAFEPIHEDIDWSLVYPELAGMHGEEGEEAAIEDEDKGTLTEQLDNLLEEAKIGPELIASLGAGMQNLSEQTSKLSNMTDASVATNEYLNNVKGASKSVETMAQTYNKANEEVASSAAQLANSYSKATSALESFSSSNSASFQEAQNYGDQLQKVSKNLSALNASYELQLQGSSDHLKATTKLYEGIQELMGNLNDSIADTKKYKQEIGQLSSNLTALNTVYGNMLTAMNFKG